MRAYLKVLGFFAAVFAVGRLARFLIAPDAVPIAYGEQTTRELVSAFLLKSVENVGLYGAILVLIFGFGWLMAGLRRQVIKR
jgi:hypothetical protein